MQEYILSKITAIRIRKNLSQNYIASRLQISQSYYNKIENGKKQMTLSMLLTIITVLDIEPGELFEKAGPKQKT